MRQYTISSILQKLFELHYTHLCKIELMVEDMNSNNPPYGSTTTNNIPIQLHSLQGQDRVSRSELYDMIVSHEAFLSYTDDIKIGSRIILTHVYLESGATEAIKHQEEKVYQVVGIIPIYGIPGPVDQMQLDLIEITPR